MEREGISTLFIHSYLRTLNRLAHFENLLFVCVFEKYFESANVRRNFVMILVSFLKNVYKVF